MALNKVSLIGNLGKDPEKRTFQNGNQVVNFTLATTDTWKDKTSGERKTQTEWHSVCIFNTNVGNIAMQYLKKGDKCYVEGKLKYRKYSDSNNVEKTVSEIVLEAFGGTLELLGGKSAGGESSASKPSSSSSAGPDPFADDAGAAHAQDRAKPRADILDEDIPF